MSGMIETMNSSLTETFPTTDIVSTAIYGLLYLLWIFVSIAADFSQKIFIPFLLLILLFAFLQT